MGTSHKIFRIVIYAICLIISTSLIMYFLWHLSNNKIYHMGVPVGVVCVELLAQYFLSLGKSKIKARKHVQGILLISIYGLYVLLFGVLSAVGFFAAEISSNIQVTTKVQQIDNLSQKRYNQINDLIASLNLQMVTEAKTGFGKNSQALLAEIKRLKAEQTTLIDQMNKESKQESVTGPVDAFSALAKMIGINANILAIIIFGSLCLFVYAGLTICNPNLEFGDTVTTNEGKKRNGKTVTLNHPVTDNPVTKDTVTDNRNVTNKELRTCPKCNAEFTVKRNSKRVYCSDACKQAVYRNNNGAIVTNS